MTRVQCTNARSLYCARSDSRIWVDSAPKTNQRERSLWTCGQSPSLFEGHPSASAAGAVPGFVLQPPIAAPTAVGTASTAAVAAAAAAAVAASAAATGGGGTNDLWGPLEAFGRNTVGEYVVCESGGKLFCLPRTLLIFPTHLLQREHP